MKRLGYETSGTPSAQYRRFCEWAELYNVVDWVIPTPLPSARQHPSYGDCLKVRRGNIIKTALCWVV